MGVGLNRQHIGAALGQLLRGNSGTGADIKDAAGTTRRQIIDQSPGVPRPVCVVPARRTTK